MPRGYSVEVVERVYYKTHGQCWYCASDISPFGNWEIEHVTPRCQGGSDDLSNLVPACRECNRAKGGRNLEEYRDLLKSQLISHASHVFFALANTEFEEPLSDDEIPLQVLADTLAGRLRGIHIYFHGERSIDFSARFEWQERHNLPGGSPPPVLVISQPDESDEIN